MGPLGFMMAVLLYFVLFKASELLLRCGSWFVYTDFWFNNILDENLTFLCLRPVLGSTQLDPVPASCIPFSVCK